MDNEIIDRLDAIEETLDKLFQKLDTKVGGRLRVCQMCTKGFVARIDAKYCCNACRQKAHNERLKLRAMEEQA